MIRELTIQNYKSVLDQTIELGRINVFIGENGCGKTNILEAVAMAAGALTGKLTVEELFNRGIRVAKPSITLSSFASVGSKEIAYRFIRDSVAPDEAIDLQLAAATDAPDTPWQESAGLSSLANGSALDDASLRELGRLAPNLQTAVDAAVESLIKSFDARMSRRQQLQLDDFAIFNLSIHALRGLTVTSRRSPLGIYGEALDHAIATLPRPVWRDVLDRAKCVSWVDDIGVDEKDELKAKGDRLGQSQSSLYFRDKFMKKRNNKFSAETVNEGILHILFYFTLFAHGGTPKIFGIDNLDTALNPQLCRDLVKQLAELAAKHDKQALVTTHNPAMLDGLNLHDDEQRLFVVYRNDEGHTVTKRIKAKPQPKGESLKLSELWTRGHLGGLPRTF